VVPCEYSDWLRAGWRGFYGQESSSSITLSDRLRSSLKPEAQWVLADPVGLKQPEREVRLPEFKISWIHTFNPSLCVSGVIFKHGEMYLPLYCILTGLESRDYGRRGSAALTVRHPLYPQKLALISPTSGGRSVGIVRSRTKATELVCMYINMCSWKNSDDFYKFCLISRYSLMSYKFLISVIARVPIQADYCTSFARRIQ
jgi:hypothetical protein